MKCEHEHCKVNDAMNKFKLKLENAITCNFSNLLISDVINLSKCLDRLVTRCVQCKVANKITDILDINNVSGMHSMFFYYGKEHLLVSLSQYLKIGIEKDEFCPVFIQPDWYKSLIEYFDHIKLSSRNIKFYPVNEMLESFLEGGTTAFNAKAQELSQWADKEGFSGVRMVGQCSYAIELSCKSDFIKFEEAINDAFRGTLVGGLCIYDFYDYVNTSSYIDDEVFEESFNTHNKIHYLSSHIAI